MAKAPEAKFLRVVDSSCTHENRERSHNIYVRGEKIAVTFKFGEETILPFEQGVKFMLDGFKVEEVDGTNLTLPAVARDGVQAELAPDEVIARLYELSLASLKIRAGQKPGGEVYLDASDDSKADIIAFIIGQPPVAGPDETKIGEIYGDADLIEDEGEENGGAGLVVNPNLVHAGGLEPMRGALVDGNTKAGASGTIVATVNAAATSSANTPVPPGKGPVTTPFTSDDNFRPAVGNGSAAAASGGLTNTAAASKSAAEVEATKNKNLQPAENKVEGA